MFSNYIMDVISNKFISWCDTSFAFCDNWLTLSFPGGGGGGVKYSPLLFFLHHPKTAQDIKLKLSDFKDSLLRHILQVKPVR